MESFGTLIWSWESEWGHSVLLYEDSEWGHLVLLYELAVRMVSFGALV